MKLLQIKKNSIAKKMMVPMVVILLIQSSLFLSTILFGGTLQQLNNNAFDILNERVINRKIDLQNLMVQQWSNVDDTVQIVNSTVAKTLETHSISYSELVPGEPITNDLLSELTDDIVFMLRRRGVTGAFLIFNGDASSDRAAERAGLYLRDYDPSNAPSDNSDLLAARAPADVVKSHAIALDSSWQPLIHFSETSSADFYFQPFDAAVSNPGIAYPDLGYWSRPHSLGPQEMKVISYSVPLLAPDGTPYGVLGVSVTTDFLRKTMPYTELDPNKDAAYLLAIERDGTLEPLFSSGPAYQRIFGVQQALHLSDRPVYGDTYTLSGSEDPRRQVIYGCVNYLNLYNTNTPFEADCWALIGLEDEQQLLGFSQQVEDSILLALGVSLLLGAICLIFISRISTMPITDLVEQVRTSNPNLPVQFNKTNIDEIDKLASAIEHLSRNVAESASKLSQIIELTSFSIGAFEYDHFSHEFFLTKRFFSVFGLSDVDCRYLTIEEFQEKMETLVKCIESEDESGGVYVFRSDSSPGTTVWARLKVVTDTGRTLGVAEDITQEMVEKRKIEYERDYDLLTNLLNRRAFHSSMEALFRQPDALGISALIMLDLDNLKYINDTYGHDYGDQYICCMAQLLKKNAPRHAILSRMSGDEFYVFLHGYNEKEQVRAIIQDIRNGILDALFPLPGDPNFRVRASAGVAWYPDDSTLAEELIRYADFAMYTVKNTVKGDFSEFNIESYKKDAYLLQGSEALNKFIDDELTDFHFQPIVDARTGEIFAYEALMRSRMSTLKSPFEILTLARTQSKLYQIERLTMFRAMDSFLRLSTPSEQCLVFINSIANQILTESDIAEFEETYRPYLSRLVVEFTEEEKLDSTLAAQKQAYLHRWNAHLALDDYGTGYNGETALLTLTPAYVKVDMSIVRNIDHDHNRLKMLQNLISYTHERQILVIAEGVETQGEMLTLIENGVDYLQGYYLGRPLAEPQGIAPHVREEILHAATAALPQ